MFIETVSENVTLIDAPFLGKSGVLGTFLVKGRSSIIIDPGPTVSSRYILDALESLDISMKKLLYVAPTHIHLDHAAGSWKLLDEKESTQLYVHPRGSAHMVDPTRLEEGARGLFGEAVSSYGEIRGVAQDKIVESKCDELIDLKGVTVQVIWTPGHASHHQCYYVIEDKVMILGDAGGLFIHDSGIIQPTTPPPFNPVKAIGSLDRLISLKPEILCYGHFGCTFNAVEKLKAHKRQIQIWNRIVFEGLEENLSYDEILNRIHLEDSMFSNKKVNTMHVERAPRISLMGFTKYHEWKKSQRTTT